MGASLDVNNHWSTSQQKLLKREVVVSILTQAKDLLEKEATVVDLDTPSDAPHVTVCGDVHGQFYD